ncbi:MAG: C40 family peptidase [Deltaproteobacteria bacterium]|nr:C40 family peptidase [Deltaproteobacteria bacterium]
MKAGGCCPASLPNGGKDQLFIKTNHLGNPFGCIEVGSFINIQSGNVYYSQDIGQLTLSYNSIDTYNGPLGKKWTHNYNRQLVSVSASDFKVLKTEDGNIIQFRLSGGIYYPENISGDTSTIVKNANGTYTQTTKNRTAYNYNASGKLTSVVDLNGNKTTLTYSGADLSAITDENGRITTITSTSGKITGIADALGRTYTLAYTDGLLTKITDPAGRIWKYTYNASSGMLTRTDPANRMTTYSYTNANGTPHFESSTDPEGNVRTAAYYPEIGIRITTITDKDGGVWLYRYFDTYSVIKGKTDPLGRTTRYTYDLKRNLTAVIAHDGSTTSYAYDANNNITSVTDPLGKITTYTYNALNLVTSITDPLNHTTQYGYDANGNLTTITEPGGAVTTYGYDSKGNITSITNPLNKTTTMTYDAANNLVSVTDPLSGAVTMTYDAVGNMLTQTDALNHTTTFQYNNLNQLVQITDHEGHVTQYTYDHNGNRLSATDANEKATYYQYNFKDQLTQIADALNNITTLSYSGSGCGSCSTGVEKLTAVTDAKTHQTAYEYNQAGNLVKETDPLGKMTTYAYDVRNNLLTRIDPDGRTITYTYDLNDRLTQKQYSGGGTTTFQYDDAGNMTFAGNSSISYTMTYDANNRITQITDSNSRTIQYQYHADGNRSQMTTPDGRTLTYTYNDNGSLSQITTPLGNFTFTYDAANRRETRSYPNGTTSQYNYNTINHLMGIQTKKDATTIDSVAYMPDAVGNRTTKTTPQESWTYYYDDVYRLTDAIPTGGIHQTEAYTYDAVGNRLTGTEPNPTAVGETTTYAYDHENRMTGVTTSLGTNTRQLTFAYDPFGRRISKTIIQDTIGSLCAAPNACPRTTQYVYDGDGIILEYDQSGLVQARYTHGPSIDEPLAVEVRSGASYIPYYYHADGLGSITALSDSAGTIVQRYEYDTFGNTTITLQGNISQPYAFTGREWHTETGMYFYRARYYDPQVGRFVTKDPIGFAGGDVNLYGYVLNNPVMLIDPSGLEAQSRANWAVDQYNNNSDAWRGGLLPGTNNFCNEFVARAHSNFPTVLRNSGYTYPTVADLSDPSFARSQLDYLPISSAKAGDIIVWYGGNVHHSAIYIGNSNVIYQNATSGVKINTVQGYSTASGFTGVPIVRRSRY